MYYPPFRHVAHVCTEVEYRGARTVYAELGVLHNALDRSLLLEIIERLPGQRSVDLEAIDECGDGDEAVRLDFLLELVVGGLVEDNGVVGLVLDCSMSAVALLDPPALGASGSSACIA